jgi:Protein of unknown function (DUF1091)
MTGEKKTPILPVPKFNYCDMRSGLSSFPVVSQLFLELSKHGNAIPKCPIKPGHYFMEAYAIEKATITRFIPSGGYYVHHQVFDENRKPFEFLNFELNVVKL